MHFHNIDFSIPVNALQLFCIYNGSKISWDHLLTYCFLSAVFLCLIFLDYMKLNSITANMLPEMKECLCHSLVGTISQPMRNP